MNTAFNRITKILLGSAIYWVGYVGFCTHQQNFGYASLCFFLIISGLLFADGIPLICTEGDNKLQISFSRHRSNYKLVYGIYFSQIQSYLLKKPA